MKLLLFDIDGTLLTTDGAGRTAMRQVAKELFSLEEDLTGITIDGNTDGGIVRQVLAKHALPVTKENINRYLEGYLICLKKNLSKTPGTILPGVSDLLNAVDTVHCAKGLLTGNLECGAQLKLRAHRLADRFEFGAFSDDSFNRNDLGPLAKARAEAKYNFPFDPSEMFVIGNTPHDIACGKAFGARTVAVATGGYRAKDLAVHEPDFLFEDFSQTFKVLQVFGLA
jgi:phosphoglycolate phosphatase-like HAD superfamily hydrolase